MDHSIQLRSTYDARLRASAEAAQSVNDCPFEFQHDIKVWEFEYARARGYFREVA